VLSPSRWLYELEAVAAEDPRAQREPVFNRFEFLPKNPSTVVENRGG
jgi:hypothetical protein